MNKFYNLVLKKLSSADISMFVMSVNEDKYIRKETVISTASCTTKCLALFAKIIHEKFGIIEGLITTVHSYIDTLNIVDDSWYENWRAGRGSTPNIIPTSTDAVETVYLFILFS
ncbi:unnamed protein product [Adineta steineri]|uniref:Glyceraldehyde 3-phosphate dehydrogenase catalytic domain-containing protein n=1 Tax=Adineta steineri TaxID=433720 RepID=A0A813VIF6_9BILA|nr:unnamed protein product [Adineta steineri]CAF3773288.1 unnamed protein product [Adineta steineri]